MNLALHKNVTMRSTQQPYTADRAVDGNTAQTLDSGSCSSTQVDAFHSMTSLSVDLGGSFVIAEIKIYYRDENSKTFGLCV